MNLCTVQENSESSDLHQQINNKLENKLENLDYFLYIDGDQYISQNLLKGSKSDQDLSSDFFYHEDPTSSFLVVLLTNRQTNEQP